MVVTGIIGFSRVAALRYAPMEVRMFFKKSPGYGKFFFTFIAGAALGAAAGLLLAPKTGKKLQKELKEGIEDLTGKAIKLDTA